MEEELHVVTGFWDWQYSLQGPEAMPNNARIRFVKMDKSLLNRATSNDETPPAGWMFGDIARA